jgi:HEPN domain-containing protein
VARVPVLIRGNLYLLAVPFIPSSVSLKLTDYIETLPEEVATTMTPEEFDIWGRNATLTASAVYKIYDLTVDDTHFPDGQRELLRRALFDLENASTSLKANEDTQGAIFNAHAAAEKFLKVALKQAGHTTDVISHKLPEIFKRLVGLRKRYSWLKSSIDALQQFAPDMNIRYRVVPRTVENAVSAIYCSLNVCSMLAQMWLFDLARGTENSEFAAARFYTDGRGSTFYCDRLSTTSKSQHGAVLISFGEFPFVGALMAEMILGQEHSSLYLEVKDPDQNKALQERFEVFRKNCRNQIQPADLGMGVHSSPEGSYAGGSIRIRLK